jgi:hypothetical protein
VYNFISYKGFGPCPITRYKVINGPNLPYMMFVT